VVSVEKQFKKSSALDTIKKFLRSRQARPERTPIFARTPEDDRNDYSRKIKERDNAGSF